MIKITLTGTQGTGKSTLAANLHDLCRRHHHKVYMIAEVADECPYHINEHATPQAQEWIWYTQLKRELAAQNANPDVIVCDRSLMDNLCYYRRIVDKKHGLFQLRTKDTFKTLHIVTKEWMPTYNYIVRLPLDTERLQSGNNHKRSKDITFAHEIDKIFDELVDPFVNISEDELITLCKDDNLEI